MVFDKLQNCERFDWDSGNERKNEDKHQVTKYECEQVFFNTPLIVSNDEKHSAKENRYYTLGKTDEGRLIFLVFTIRNKMIRVISARDMSKKEREVYEKENT